MKVEFREPPRADAYAHVDHKELAAHLRQRPGEWALVPKEYANNNTARSMACWIRKGNSAYAPEGAFESIARKDADDVTRVWVRFKGEAAQEAA